MVTSHNDSTTTPFTPADYLAGAKKLHEQGAHLVCLDNDKKPLRKGWLDEPEGLQPVINYLTNFPNCCVGVKPHSVGLVGVDVDRGGMDGVKAIIKLLGEPLALYESNPGKYHLLYAADKPWGNANHHLPDTGEHSGEIRCAKGCLRVPQTKEAVEGWLEAIAKAKAGAKAVDLNRIMKKPPKAKEGRNNTLNKAVFDAYLNHDKAEAERLAKAAIEKAKADGLDDTEVRSTVQSARKAAKAKRKEKPKGKANGKNIELPPVLPWEQPFSPHLAVWNAVKLLKKYVRFETDGDALLAVLWALFTHFQPYLKRLGQQPFLNITSATKGCGKTTCLMAVQELSKASLAGAGSLAAMRRVINEHKPAIFLDEADKLLAPKNKSETSELFRAMFNQGYTKKTANYLMCDTTDNNKVIALDCWTPICLVGIGNLFDDTQDRCISIYLTKAKEGIPDFASRTEQEILEIWEMVQRQFARIAEDYHKYVDKWLHKLDLAGLSDLRGIANYRPLLAIATVVSNLAKRDWLYDAAFDAVRQNADDRAAQEEPTVAERVLAFAIDYHNQNQASQDDFIPSAELLTAMHKQDEWNDFTVKGEPISKERLGKEMRKYKILKKQKTIGGTRLWGWYWQDILKCAS